MSSKHVLASFIIVSFILFTLLNSANSQAGASQPSLSLAPIAVNPSPTGAASLSLSPTLGVSALKPSPTVKTGKYRDGVYTGNVTDAFYGNIQVQVKIQNGAINDIGFLQYPNDRGNSIEINSQALPYLRQEAIQNQTAQVDTVSGATATSDAFVQSLQSALSQAKT